MSPVTWNEGTTPTTTFVKGTTPEGVYDECEIPSSGVASEFVMALLSVYPLEDVGGTPWVDCDTPTATWVETES